MLYRNINKYWNKVIEAPKYHPPSIVTQLKNASLHSYEGDGDIPLLIVPSHINKGYIVDLTPRASLLKNIGGPLIKTYLLEWNDPIGDIYGYDESSYVENILLPLIEELYKEHGRKVYLVGYCMGGMLAIASSIIASEYIAGIILLATPWNFHCASFPYRINESLYHNFSYYLEKIDVVTKEFIGLLMQGPHLNSIKEKIIDFSENNKLSVAVENWLDDGINMTVPLFEVCINKFLLQNQPFNNKWRVMNQEIVLEKVTVPSLNIIAKKDSIIPQESSYSLINYLPNNSTIYYDTGHLGIIISEKVDTGKKIKDWICAVEGRN